MGFALCPNRWIAAKLVVGLAVNEYFFLGNITITPKAIAAWLNVSGCGIIPICLGNDVKVSVKSVAVSVHAHETEV